LEHFSQVVLDNGGADEQLGGDLAVRAALGDEPGHLRLLQPYLHRSFTGTRSDISSTPH
jgi:hypothetical protein